jgi:hypothetical protein
VASRDTLLSRAVRNDWIEPPPADLVIVDESHRVMSDLYQSAPCRTADGRAVHLWIEPKERAIRCQEEPADQE